MTLRRVAPRRTYRRRITALAATVAMCAGSLLAATPAMAIPNADIGYPTFAGDQNPVPTAPVAYTPGSMLGSIFTADLAAGAGSDPDHDFWIDRMLARTGTAGDSNAGNSDNNQWLFSRGRTLFMKAHDPGVLGFGGQVAYIESIDNKPAYTISVSVAGQPVSMREDSTRRKQTPSYWRAVFVNGGAGLTITETKYITDANVAVTGLQVANTSGAPVEVTLTATSPYATTADGAELTGVVKSFNNLTTIKPRLSGDGFTPADGALSTTLSVPAGGTAGTKVQSGFITDEIPESRTEYDAYRAATPAAAYTTHVTAYNKWWADNIPYIDTPEDNIDKTLFYRWWLTRFNMLDANVPGNDYQFPTAVEGALGYNNAIVLTSGMFIDDLKYLRDPKYAYGTWVSAGQVAKSSKYVDNPGDPANWSNSYTEYITEAAWRSYQLHGGPSSIAASLGTYGENDVRGLLANFDSNNNKLIEYNWGAMTGNDADAVSFHWRPGANMDRTESAYLYSNAKGAAAAYRAAGQTAKADAMDALAAQVQQAVLSVLWNPQDKLLEHRIVGGDQASVPWKETNNYYPFTVGLMPKPDGTAQNDQYTEALRLWADADEYPIFPFFTADQKDKAAAAAAGEPGSNNFSVINSTVTFRFLSSVLRNYPSSYITPETYKKLLYWNAWAHYQSGDNRYPDQNEFWADGSADPQKIGYRSWIHHTQLGTTNFTVIEDVAGLRARDDSKIELSPIDIGWDHFTVNNIKYRDKDLTIVWDKPGDGNRPYGTAVPEGYSVYLDGSRVLTLDSLKPVVFDPSTGDVQLPAGGSVLAKTTASVAAANQVSLDGNASVVDLFAKAGQDIVTADGNPVDLAAGATATASFSATGRGPAGAVDGTTINEPFWGTAGSPNATDSIEVDLGAAKTFDDIRVHFYRSSTSGTVPGYAEPAAYRIEYQDGTQWKPMSGQLRTPIVPQANFNEARFSPVTAQKVRITVTHQPGSKTAIKEVLVTSTGATVAAPGNQAPVADAYVDTAASTPDSAVLVGSSKDDGLPTGAVSSAWSVLSAPAGGAAVFTSPTNPSTTVKFTADGTYVLRLTVTDGELTSTKDVTVAGSVGQAGGANVAPSATPTASYTAGWNNVNAVNNGTVLNTGGAQSDLWGTWSGDRPKTQWLQYNWAAPVRVKSADVTFWRDSPRGTGNGVAVPASWTLQYLAADGSTWVDVPNPSGFGVAEDGTNTTTFDAVSTTALRATFTADSDGTSYSGLAVSEWAVGSDSPVSTGAVHVPTTVGVVPTLPATVEQVYADGARLQAAVTWPAITADQVAGAGSHFDVIGVVDGGGTATATVWVRVNSSVQINVIDPVSANTYAGVMPTLPSTVTALYNDGSKDSRIAVVWDPIAPAEYAAAGTFQVSGTVEGTDKRAVATVTVTNGSVAADTTAPTTSMEVAPDQPDGQNGYYVKAVTVTASATDDRDPAPMIEAKVDGAEWAPVSAPITLARDGDHTVAVRSTDESGNVSAEVSRTVSIDATAPVSNNTFDPTTRTLTLQGADAVSRLDKLVYNFDGGEWQDYSSPVTIPDAATIVNYAAYDRAGNREADNVVKIGPKPVPPATSTTKLALSATDLVLGGKVTASVQVAGKGVPTGTVVISAGSIELGRAALVNGRARIQVSTAALLPGSVDLTASYSGDDRNLSSTATKSLSLAPASSSTTMSLTRASVGYGTDVAARIRVSAVGITPTGPVEIKEGDTVLATETLAAGKATVALPVLPVGQHTLTVSYAGDERTAASSANTTLTVTKVPTTVRAKITPTKVTTATQATVAATVSSAVPGLVPAGSVEVTVRKDGAVVTTRSGALSGGLAGIPLPTLEAGRYQVSIAYGGSAVTDPSSSTVALTVTK